MGEKRSMEPSSFPGDCRVFFRFRFTSVWGWFGPAYKAPRFHSGPGEMRVLNSDWPLGWEAVSEEMR